eukprot:TRINITY_DN26653_c1_g1_i2.p1 TRINITY_DN26653_c1_g1~~TRINITY_DN26653_c1_g1_i2.p1  ORF type:complete len:514 (+),score=135.89 TRINITY_DN26653_c1_g1_i2:80-1543(+)
MRWGGAALDADVAGCCWAAAVHARGGRACECSGAPTQGAAEPGGGGTPLPGLRLQSPSPPRAGSSSEGGLSDSGPSLSDAGAQTDPISPLGPVSGARGADLRALAKGELQQRKAVYTACGSELVSLLAAALCQEAVARAAEGAALRAQLAAASGAAASAGLRAAGAERERDAVQEQLRITTERLHAAQLSLQCLAAEHAAALEKADRLQNELGAAIDAQRDTQAQICAVAERYTTALYKDLVDGTIRVRCGYEEEHARRRRAWREVSAAEESGRRALEDHAGNAMLLLCSESDGRALVATREAKTYRLLRHKFQSTGRGTRDSDAIPASKALKIDVICYSVATFVPEDWAPVCSTSSRAAWAVMHVHSLGWKEGEDILGPFRSKGRHNGYDNQHYGSEPGPVFSAMLDVQVLLSAVYRTHGFWGPWHERWVVHMEYCINLYEEMRVRYKELFLTCRTLGKKASCAADRIQQALTMYEERTEAEGGAE